MKPIEDLAREAAESLGNKVEYHCDRVWLERFAALVRAQTLDEAAAICANRGSVQRTRGAEEGDAYAVERAREAEACASELRALATEAPSA